MSVADNYENSLKSLNNNKGTMYLSVINSEDAPMKPFKKLVTKRDWSINLFNMDIECSQPRKFGIFTNKVDFINKVDDIEKANPKIIFFKFNKPEYNLSNKDIEKSFPSVYHFNTKRVTNPLQPQYKFPEADPSPLEVPKFIKDSLDVKDISGASPQKKIYFIKKEALSEKLRSIEGSGPRIPYFRKNLGSIKYDYLDYSDVNQFIFKTKRHINALDPIYIFQKEGKEKPTFIGPVKNSKSNSKYPYYYKPSYNLKNDDIKGTNTDSINHIKKFRGKNFNLCVSDIPKTNAGSLKKGIITTRCINPLNPIYQYLGEKEEKERNNNIIGLKKKCDIMPLISDINIKKESENNKENNNNNELKKIDNSYNEKISISNNDYTKNKSIRIIKNICDKDKISGRLNKFKIHKFNINITNKEKEFKKSNSTMNLVNQNMKLEDIKGKTKKIIRFTPLLKSEKRELINNTNIDFDRTKFGKKPCPFYGYSHDPLLHSKENKARLDEIEKSKYEKEVSKKKYEQFIFNKQSNYIAEEYKKNPNENNLIFISENPSLIQSSHIIRKNIDDWCNLNHNKKNGLFNYKNKSFSMRHLCPRKKLYSEQMDSFLNINSIQKNIDDRSIYFDNSSQQINPSEYTKRALLD